MSPLFHIALCDIDSLRFYVFTSPPATAICKNVLVIVLKGNVE